MDRALPAVRLPPVARLACILLGALAAAFPAAPAGARALAPPPVRLAVVWDRPTWAAVEAVRLPPPPGRWEARWAAAPSPTRLPNLPRSLDG
ncbi:MAG: hypothetical protein FJW79_07525 [Actinobacteria bacterium]|nr:hypothetical protein [Actinomycetota bacterium]